MSSNITNPQRAALTKLAPVVADRWYLGGGTGVTAHLGHRTSRDIDLFSADDPADLLVALEPIPGLRVTSRSAGTLHLDVEGLPVSLLRYPYPILTPPAPVAELPVDVASLDDLAAMKISAIAGGGAARDFWDLHEIAARTRRSLAVLVNTFRRKYPKHDLGHVLKSLTYFGDAEATPLPPGLDHAAWDQICADFRSWTRDLALAP